MAGSRVVWQVSKGSFVGLWALTLFFVGCWLAALPGATGAISSGVLAVLGASLLCLLPAAVSAGFALRCRVVVENGTLSIRNLLSERSYALAEVVGASAGYAGLSIEFRDGTSTTGMAVMKSNAAGLLKVHTRGDRIAEELVAMGAHARRDEASAG